MKWKSIWRHTSYIIQTLAIYFLLIQGPYDLWIEHTGYRIGEYLLNIIGISVLFFLVELTYNYFRQRVVDKHTHHH
ncbi:hypothetical protein [Lactiplantibacillus fabifermentans]|uniref:Uncharacterized protein n=2 Tax=Lactiplantibacillus fabifermentans TaxID=483011 RepID=A0A0R2NMV9_9LACO|nr:hypothetical protein [Lactiplantibacillus fabifermentans]ETY73423.1 hypothetical protein LFAB_12420 [Lactiplantibacillus fabifermentans T30PCM01]KRO27065.1 hypothetical protein DY78_GL000354 [Lactiplantibacillus fabifermentans DSM 21115]